MAPFKAYAGTNSNSLDFYTGPADMPTISSYSIGVMAINAKAIVQRNAFSFANDMHVHRASRSWAIKFQEKDILPSATDESPILDWECT